MTLRTSCRTSIRLDSPAYLCLALLMKTCATHTVVIATSLAPHLQMATGIFGIPSAREWILDVLTTATTPTMDGTPLRTRQRLERSKKSI